ncbi:MAG: hypothetical protein H5T68_13110 [Chloroflexi bacterium]|nr:hypothetical protein [Chloroflexota bacterium]
MIHFLYGGDEYYRFCQGVLLGIGGVRMLRVLGYENIRIFHMNEGHSAFLTLELLDAAARKAGRESLTGRQCEINVSSPLTLPSPPGTISSL